MFCKVELTCGHIVSLRPNKFLKDHQLEVVAAAEENGKESQDILQRIREHDQGTINGIRLLEVLLIFFILKALGL